VDGNAVIDPALRDTATSPLKDKDMDIDNDGNLISGTKRNLAEQFSEEGIPTAVGTNGNANGIESAGLLLENTLPMEEVEDGKDGNENNNKPKRKKKDGTDSPSLGSASSREELVQSQ
jgi:hypothetical protein